MAGKQLKRDTKLSASTILEVVIAMVVIVTVFTIAMMIFSNVQRLSLSVKKVRAAGILNDVLLTSEKTPAINKQTFVVDDIRVEEDITTYNNNSNLRQIDLTAYDQNQEKVAELKEVVNAD